MNDEIIKVTRQWLLKARNDLKSASKLSSGTEPLLDTGIYHCQQAAEKSLKGYLVFSGIEFSKSHDLRLLITLAGNNNNEFLELMEAGEILTPYAVEYRYPDDVLEPDIQEYEEAFKLSCRIYDFVLNQLQSFVSF